MADEGERLAMADAAMDWVEPMEQMLDRAMCEVQDGQSQLALRVDDKFAQFAAQFTGAQPFASLASGSARATRSRLTDDRSPLHTAICSRLTPERRVRRFGSPPESTSRSSRPL